MKILVSGADGQLGRCLVDQAEDDISIELVALNRAEMDISELSSVQTAIEKHCPDFMINAAAYTAVDKAETEQEKAYLVNHIGSKNLAEICAVKDIPLIHVSTDYVFNGENSTPYLETDETCPQSIYGESKLAGEKEVQKWDKHIIVRTAWVFSEYGNNFVKTMLRLAESRDQLSIVNDQIGCPTYAADIASALLSLCRSKKHRWGIYNYVGANQMSWCDFAQQIFEKAKQKGALNKTIQVLGIPGSDYPTPAARPSYSVLSNNKITDQYQAISYSLDSALNRVIDKLF